MMPKLTVVFGLLLVALGLVAYFILSEPDSRSITAMIPAFVGAPLIVLGVLAMKPSMRKLAMHIAVVVGLLGFLAPLGRLVPQMMQEGFLWSTAATVQALLAVISLVFVILCVGSFISARKSQA